MKLFLTSGGITSELRADFLEFLNKDPGGLKVAFIPTAADAEEGKWFVNKARNELIELGFEVTEVDLKDYPEGGIEKVLEDKDIIYVNGGNTYYLLYWVRKSGLDKCIRDLLNQDKIYVGSSAGSIVAGPNIGLAGWKPDEDIDGVRLENLSGMNLMDFAISPHFGEYTLEKVQKKKEKFPYKVIVLTDNQAVEVINRDYRIVGLGDEIVLV